MQAAAGSVSWVAAQPSVLGRCGGGGASLKGSAGGGVGGGGCRVRGRDVAVPRCCARAQEKRPPRVRKSKEERREMVESFINSYRLSNEGKFPSVNLTHKEVGGSYYIVREIVRDVIQENRVLGPGGLDAMALSFEDCADSSESSVKHELGQESIEILDISGSEVSKGYVTEISTDESFPVQDDAISTQTLLEAGVLNSVVQNGSAADAIFMETNLEKQDEVPSEGSIEFDLNSPSEEQAHLIAQVSDSDQDIALNSLVVDAKDGTASSATNRIIPPLESSSVYENNAAPLRDHKTLPNDNGSTDGAVDDTNLLVATNGAQAKQASLHEHDASTGSVSMDNAQSLDGQFSTTVSTDPINGSKLEAEVATKTVEAYNVNRLQDEFEQSLLNANRDGKENSDSPVPHPTLHTKGLLHTEDEHSVVQVDKSEFKNSTSGITKEEVQATDFKHEQEIGTRTAISRKTLKDLQKKDDNLFWLVLRAFVVAISKIWAK